MQDEPQAETNEDAGAAAVGRRRQAAREPGAERVQARRARARLPEVHFRPLRGAPRVAGVRASGRWDQAERVASFLEDRDEYTSQNVFWVPENARWGYVQSRAKLTTVGQDIDTANGPHREGEPVCSRCCSRETMGATA